jgi:L-alanine-DL-glutamate epimerase-like enolase superfamily enzyme
MKITGIETFVTRIPYTCGGPLPSLGGKVWNTADTLLVRVETDEGITGWGEAFGYNIIPATRTAILDVVRPLYIGRDPTQIEALSFEVQQQMHIFGRVGPAMFAISGIDIALWDIAGKRAGKPLHELLGGSAKKELTCYASLMRYTDPAIVADNTARAIGEGYRFVKLHEITVEATRAARSAAGADIALMLDTNCPWSARQALEMAKRLKAFDLYWLEEPCWPPENAAALARVRREGGIPVAAGENWTTSTMFHQMFEAEAVDFAQLSPTKCGGISEARKIIALAAAHNVTLAPHTPYFGPGFLAGLHLNAAQAQDVLVEWLYFDLETTLFGDAILPVNGKVKVPTGPGLGFDPDPKLLKKYADA